MEAITFKNVSYKYPETEKYIFQNYSLQLPSGVISFLGQNGTGKSTLLLLAGGTLLPTSGTVSIHGINTATLRDEAKRQEYISFVYQNMEFETEECIDSLLKYVYTNGFHKEKKDDFIRQLIDVFELEKVLEKKTQQLSKGELQRTILAFSLLYGSKILLLDEPVFALESYQKEKAMQFLSEYARQQDLPIYFSVHELELSEKYADHILLFQVNAEPELGPAGKILTREKLEQAYQVPFAMLKKKESLYRDALKTVPDGFTT